MDKIEKIKSEEQDFYSDDDIYNFNSWGADLSFRELIDRYDDNELIKPELQRKYVWDKAEASRFIDSILLGLPVPSIFLAKKENETLLIIDGYQRIMTVYDYVNGIFSKDGKVFRLSKSEKINSRWSGKAFSELKETQQRKIRNTTIHAIIFVQTHPNENDTGMYQVFERINTSGRTLLPQEIRNCVYQGPFNDLLFRLNDYESWRNLFGNQQDDPRMRDMEFILRFLTLKHLNLEEIERTSISLKKELNIFMGNPGNNTEESLNNFEKLFKETSDIVYSMFGKTAFHNLSKTNPNKLANKFNPTIFDSIMIAVSSQEQIPEKENWETIRRELLNDEEYQDAIRIRTTNIEKIQRRINLAQQYLFGDE